MRRRDFLFLGGAATAWPLAAHAQVASAKKRVAVLIVSSENDSEAQLELTALRQALGEHGWLDANNLTMTVRGGARDPTRAAQLATELINSAPDVILASSATAVNALRPISGSIPIVFVQVPDPIGQGFVASFARPGGTITGFTNYEISFMGKWLDLFKQIDPGLTEIGLLLDPGNVSNALFLPALKQAATLLALTLVELPAKDNSGIVRVLAEFVAKPKRGLLVIPSPFSITDREEMVREIQHTSLPAMYWDRSFALLGGLVSYGVDIPDNFRRAADYIDRILRGARAAELPVQNPTKFDLVINVKTAKALGLAVPQSLLVQADQVIE